MPRLKEDYDSRKWSSKSNRLLTAPSFSRSYLTKVLAAGFENKSQRGKWLALASSSIAPSTVPPDEKRDDPPSPEKKKVVHIQNRASYFRIKSCPPNFLLSPKNYSTIIDKNRAFELDSKSIVLAQHDYRMLTGETLHGFLLGSRYTNVHYFDSGPVNKRVPYTLPPGHKDNVPADVGTSGSQSKQSTTRTMKHNEGASSKSPGHSLSEKRDRSPTNTPVERALTMNLQDVNRPASPLKSEHDSQSESTETGQDSQFHEDAHKFLQKPDVLVEEPENYFISAEAQKLTGEILQESQLLDQEGGNDVPEDSALNEEDIQEHQNIVGITTTESVTGLQDTPPSRGIPDLISPIEVEPSVTPDRPEVEIPDLTPPAEVEPMVAEAVKENSVVDVMSEETIMTSKSNTIIVDMSYLSLPPEEGRA